MKRRKYIYFFNKNHIYQNQEFILTKEQNLFKVKVENRINEILIKCQDYEINLTNLDFPKSKLYFSEIKEIYEFLVDLFKKIKVEIKELIINEIMKLKLNLKEDNEKDIEIILINKNKCKKINKNNLDKNYNEIKNNRKRLNDEIIKMNINPEDIQVLTTLVNNSYCYDNLDNTFTSFKSIDDILYLIYSNEIMSIIFYNLVTYQKINEIKKAHNKFISNFRYYLDRYNKRDLIMSISSIENNIKIWNVQNCECLCQINNIYNNGVIYSACFLCDNNEIYIVTTNYNEKYSSNPIKIFDLKKNEIKELVSSNYKTYFIDSYYDNESKKNYIVSGNLGFIKCYDYYLNKEYRKYYESNKYDYSYHCSLIIKKYETITKIIESTSNGIINIWNFHSGQLLNKINVCDDRLYSICLWSNEYLFVGCENNSIILINLENGRIINNHFIAHSEKVLTLKKILHPKYGECLISQGFGKDNIKLWIS